MSKIFENQRVNAKAILSHVLYVNYYPWTSLSKIQNMHVGRKTEKGVKCKTLLLRAGKDITKEVNGEGPVETEEQ